MRIAILGTRGIPARYGGFETFAAELSSRLAGRGHHVSVYCRKHLFQDNKLKYEPFSRIPCIGSIKRILLPCIKSKHLETLSHTFLSILHLIHWKVTDQISAPSVIILCNGANAPLIPLLRAFKIKVVLNVDGIERMRKKWGLAGSLWYRIGEWCAVNFPNAVVSDADVIADYYATSHTAKSEVITYGFDDSRDEDVRIRLNGGEVAKIDETLNNFDLIAGRYILYVSRLEPENNCHQVLEAYKILKSKVPTLEHELVIVGNAPYADNYIAGLKQVAISGVKFLGFQFGETYRDLMLGATTYIQATEVGGTHPALVESMGFGNVVIANYTPENAEVLGTSGYLYQKNSIPDLVEKLEQALSLDTSEMNSLQKQARQRAESNYAWSGVVEKYEELSDRVLYDHL